MIIRNYINIRNYNFLYRINKKPNISPKMILQLFVCFKYPHFKARFDYSHKWVPISIIIFHTPIIFLWSFISGLLKCLFESFPGDMSHSDCIWAFPMTVSVVSTQTLARAPAAPLLLFRAHVAFLEILCFTLSPFFSVPLLIPEPDPFLKHRSQVSVCSCADHYGLLSPQSPGLASHGVFLVHNLVGLCSRSLSSPGQLLLVIFIKKGQDSRYVVESLSQDKFSESGRNCEQRRHSAISIECAVSKHLPLQRLEPRTLVPPCFLCVLSRLLQRNDCQFISYSALSSEKSSYVSQGM